MLIEAITDQGIIIISYDVHRLFSNGNENKNLGQTSDFAINRIIIMTRFKFIVESREDDWNGFSRSPTTPYHRYVMDDKCFV